MSYEYVHKPEKIKPHVCIRPYASWSHDITTYTVIRCKECGKYWWYAPSNFFRTLEDWKPVRWYNFKVLNIIREKENDNATTDSQERECQDSNHD
jgi:hypothetical protein